MPDKVRVFDLSRVGSRIVPVRFPQDVFRELERLRKRQKPVFSRSLFVLHAVAYYLEDMELMEGRTRP